MKMIRNIFEWIVILACILGFYSLIFNLSWRYWPLGFLIGYSLAVAIEHLTQHKDKGGKTNNGK